MFKSELFWCIETDESKEDEDEEDVDDDGEVDKEDGHEPVLPDEDVDDDLVMDCCELPFDARDVWGEAAPPPLLPLLLAPPFAIIVGKTILLDCCWPYVSDGERNELVVLVWLLKWLVCDGVW